MGTATTQHPPDGWAPRIKEEAKKYGYNDQLQSSLDTLTPERLWSILEGDPLRYAAAGVLVNYYSALASATIMRLKDQLKENGHG